MKMTLPKIPDIELVAIEGMERMAKFIGVERSKIGEAHILVTEALINALEHSGQEVPCVTVKFSMDKEKVVIDVSDSGKGFDVNSVEEPDISKKMSGGHKRGWGLKLMKTVSDEFLLESGKDGTKITLIKKFK